MIQAVIFDMGGVLLRTEDRAPRTALGARFGRSYEEMDELVFNSESARHASVGAIPEEEHWKSIARGLEFDAADIPAFRDAFWGGDRVDDDLLDFIDALRPGIRTALLSNAWSNARADVAGKHNLLRAFDIAIFSAELGLAKPDARIYQHVLSLLDLPAAAAVFVDDVPANIEAAQKLGMHAVLFRSNPQTKTDLLALIQQKSME